MSGHREAAPDGAVGDFPLLNCWFRSAWLALSERSESKGEMSEWLKEHAWKLL